MNDIHEILQKYWKHSQFRPLQKEIIESVLAGKDTLALLPTGGGKSICFQIPAIVQAGICIVVSPLVALMKDQVYQLVQRGIPATAIFSGMHKREIEFQLNKCIYGEVKFLYVSPERLKTPIFIERFKSMKVNLIAVDEAHCISQWGYDFRPSYLDIAEIRTYHPVPVIALTATATTEVAADIQEKLLFKKNNLFQATYERENLTYHFAHEENKMQKTIELLNHIKGSGLIYLRNRAKTKEMAEYLNHYNISIDYYHAGLSHEERQKKQTDWISGKTRIMACTNAFGMGIDKPDVRIVIHHDFPENIESYFQEAGRAGRDGVKAFSILLYNQHDLDSLQARKENFPTIPIIKEVYAALYSQYQIGYEDGINQQFPFDLRTFVQKNDLNIPVTLKAIELLEQSGVILTSDAVFRPSRLMINATKADLYKYQIENPQIDPLVKFILRTYAGVFDTFVKIDENFIAKKLGAKKIQIVNALQFMASTEILLYLPSTDEPLITFLENRMENKLLELDNAFIEKRRIVHMKQIESLQEIVLSQKICRVKQLLKYFGEDYQKTCGHCDICRKKKPLSFENFSAIKSKIETLLKDVALLPEELISKMPEHHKNEVLETIEWLISNEIIERGLGNSLSLS